MALTEAEALELAQRIVIRLCGNRWVFPPVRMVDIYPIPQSRMVYVSGRPIVEIHSVSLEVHGFVAIRPFGEAQ